MVKYSGTIRSYNDAKGFGFIESARIASEFGGADCYVHSKCLEFSRLTGADLQPGTPVTFEVHVSEKGKAQASSITIQSGRARPTATANAWGSRAPVAAANNGGRNLPHSRPSGLLGALRSSSPGAGDWGGKGQTARPNGGALALARKGAPPSKAAGKAAGKGVTGGKTRPTTSAKRPLDSSAPPWNATAGAALDIEAASRKAEEAVQNALGSDACAKVLGETGPDGSPKVVITLTMLNNFLRAGGFPTVEGSEEVPEDGESLRGFDGQKVDAATWYSGTLREFFDDQNFGVVDSDAFKAKFPERDLFVHADHLDPDSDGNLVAQVGEEMLFPLVEDEEGNAWAWGPLIPREKKFMGKIDSWHSTYGYIQCDTLWPVFEHQIYLHGNAANLGGVKNDLGTPVVFNLHVNATGKPQASSPHPPGVESTRQANRPVEPAMKRQRTDSKQAARAVAAEYDEWFHGSVKSYHEQNGFGFIACQETFDAYGRDVFMHHTVANEAGATAVGQSVTFQIQVTGEGHPQARRVKLN
eukprot:TRINITY_DN75676_c0_g1_i1.p1 TRINITY_DN75676_c0_g1~~TRINITY_DN75676_c0_g1_i1.p1  ORF type:complete len:528 (-),score=98.96 TRINITY_DN75676_c0_g1_i1:56-1639(-)